MHLILDLDETCISSIEYADKLRVAAPDEKFLKHWEMEGELTVYLRPKLIEFLTWAFENHSVSVWSAGSKEYVLDIVAKVMPRDPIMILWNEHCQESLKDTGCLKSLQWLIAKIPCLVSYGPMLLVDDLPENCNQDNTRLIKPFNATEQNSAFDNELKQLAIQLKI